MLLLDAGKLFISENCNVLSPSTIRSYNGIMKNHLQMLWSMDISDIKNKDIQRAINEDAIRLSRKTIDNALGLVFVVLRQHDINISMSNFRRPQKQRVLPKYLRSHDAIQTFMSLVKGTDLELPTLLALWLSLRRGEIFGLCWDCIDLENSLIHVQRTLVLDTNNHWILRNGAKTFESQRTLHLPDYICHLFAEIAPENREGRCISVNIMTFEHRLRALCIANNLSIRSIHPLRHTNATVMADLNIPEKVILERGGWSTDNVMKSVYRHTLLDSHVKAQEDIDYLFNSIMAKKRPLDF